MPGTPVEIVVCPPELVEGAMAIALRSLDPAQRDEMAAPFNRGVESTNTLFIAIRNGVLVDAAWGHLQPGNTAVLWPPQGTDDDARQLVRAVSHALDKIGVCMAQTLVASDDVALTPVLEAADFTRLAELLYLTWEATAGAAGSASTLEFEPFHESQLARLTKLIETTYEGTQDCPALNGRRPIENVIDGYRATGVFRPENWQFVRAGGEDVGVLLLAEHAQGRFTELVYMGLRPEHRGRGWGRIFAQKAQQMARAAGVARLLVAVDAGNFPALATYDAAGFHAWDRRTVYVRFRGGAR